MYLKLLKKEDFLKKPVRKHNKDAGADVHATESITLKPGDVYKMSLGFGVEVPNGYMGLILPRSGHALKGVIPGASPIDCGYTGTIHAILTNTSDKEVEIIKGERIAQLVIQPIVIAEFYDEDDAEEVRGDNGFNSTGKL